MKLIYFSLIIVLLFASACTQNEKIDIDDHSTLITVLQKFSDSYLEAWNDKDLNALNKLTSNGGQYFGSDPEEIMDKNALLEMYSSFFEDESSSYIYRVDSRKIIISPGGNSAVIYERIIFDDWSPNMPLCQTSHLIKTKHTWKINFISWGFIIKNDEVVKINKIL